MANEPLGIFEELQERTRTYAAQCAAVRERIIAAGPFTPHGPYAELNNPFARRFRACKPYHREWPSYRRRRRLIHDEGTLGLTIVQVIQAVVLESGVTADKLLEPNNRPHVAQPRHVAVWACDRYCPEYSLPDLGFIFRRDHTTIMHSIRWVNTRLEAHDPVVQTWTGNVRLRLHTSVDVDA